MSPTLVLMLAVLEPVPQPTVHPDPQPPRRLAAQPLAGGAASTTTTPLIGLIQTNVAPQSWQANGGKGSAAPFGFGGAVGGNAAAGGKVGGSTGGTSLINLIQTNVAPSTWDVNGGKGSITPFWR